MPLETSRVEELFHAAQQIGDPVQRQAWLQEACAGDAELQHRVESLLRASADASGFLNLPAIELAGELRRSEGTLDYDSHATSQTANQDGHSRQDVLTFLQPTSRPDSLGRLGHYEVLEVIGQGGFGTVLRAFDDKLHRVVALKVLAPELAANGSARKRFIREARTAAAVKNEHVVAIYEVDENAQPPYLAMEMIDGKSLQDKIDQHGPLSLKEILRIGLQMAEGLAAAHKQGLVHRDVKPANILLENGVERVKLTDFGLARAVDDASVTQSGTVAGTPLYMSPEQAEGLAVDHRSDLFSLGTVLYAMCTGHSAFRASGTHAVLKRVIEASPRPIRELNPDLPEWLEAIIAKLHARQPADRFQSAAEVASLLGQHLAHEQNPAAVPRPAPVVNVGTKVPESRPATSGLSTAAIVLLVLGLVVSVPMVLVCVGIGSYFFHHRSSQTPLIAQGVLSLELNDTNIAFRIDGHGPNQTAVSNVQLPLEAGKHRVWLKLNDVEMETDPFFISPGKQSELRVTIEPQRAEAIYDGKPLAMTQSAGDPVAIEIGPGTIRLPAEPYRLPGKAASVPSDEGFVSLFNGRDLTGWKSHPDEPGDWKVEYGVISSAGKPSYLYSERGDFGDFYLRCEVQINAGGDGGIVVRAPFERATVTGLPGYEAQIYAGRPVMFGWGTGAIGRTDAKRGWSLLAEVWSDTPIDRWIPLEIIARGNRIETRVGGQLAAEYVDAEGAYQKGHIVLQQSGPKTRVKFRKLQIKELPTHAASAQDEPAATALRELVAAAERARDAALARYEVGTVTRLTVLNAEVALVEARLRMTMAEENQVETVRLLKELVAHWSEGKRLMQQRIESGIEPTSAINQIDLNLADAKARLAAAEATATK